MRPEGTAPAVRAYVGRSQWNREPITRWYYLGPMFRHEKAQRGRLRQFHQVGAEVFGLASASIDAELIAMLTDMLVEFGIPVGELDVAINTLGEPEERVAYREALRAYFTQHREALDEDSKRRLETNPLRILDSKNPEVLAVCAGAPVLLDTLGPASRTRFEEVRTLLAALGC
jgi:histidyl-tRNA synthetase